MLSLLASAVAGGATRFRMSRQPHVCVFEYEDGLVPTADELRNLYSSLFLAEKTAEVQRLKELALGLNAALALKPKMIQLETWDGTESSRLRLTADSEKVEAIKHPPIEVGRRRVRIEVREPALKALTVPLGQPDLEAAALTSRCGYAPLELSVLDVAVGTGIKPYGLAVSYLKSPYGGRNQALLFSKTEGRGYHESLSSGPFSAVMWFPEQPQASSEITFVINGVSFPKRVDLGCKWVNTVVAAPHLGRDLSHEGIVENEDFATLVGHLRDGVNRLLATVAERWSSLGPHFQQAAAELLDRQPENLLAVLNTDKVIEVYRTLFEFRRSVGLPGPDMANGLQRLAELLMERGHREEAGRLYEEIVPALLEAAETRRELGQLNDAVQLAERGLDILERNLPEACAQRVTARCTAARIYLDAKREKEALDLFNKAADDLHELEESESAEAAEARQEMAMLMHRMGDDQPAMKLQERVVSWRLNAKRTVQTARSLAVLADLHWSCGERQKAEQAYREALEIALEGSIQPESTTLACHLVNYIQQQLARLPTTTRSETCGRCFASNIVHGKATAGLQVMLGYRYPNSIPKRGEVLVEVVAVVCQSCGAVDLKAKNLADLRRKVKEVKAPPED